MSFFSLIKEKGMSIIGKIRGNSQSIDQKNVPVINEEVLKTCIGTRSVVSEPMPNQDCPNGCLRTEIICKGEDGKINIYSVPATFSPKAVMNNVYGKDPESFHIMPKNDAEFLESLKTDSNFCPIEKVGDMRSFSESFLESTFSDKNALSTYMDPKLLNDETAQDIALASTTVLENHLEIERNAEAENEKIGLPTMHMAGTDNYVSEIVKQCDMLQKLNQENTEVEDAGLEQ